MKKFITFIISLGVLLASQQIKAQGLTDLFDSEHFNGDYLTPTITYKSFLYPTPIYKFEKRVGIYLSEKMQIMADSVEVTYRAERKSLGKRGLEPIWEISKVVILSNDSLINENKIIILK